MRHQSHLPTIPLSSSCHLRVGGSLLTI
jgi:hypothetical protein